MVVSRSYSPSTGAMSCEQTTNSSLSTSLRSSAARRSCVRVHEAPQEADRDRAHAGGDHLLARAPHVVLVERADDRALVVDPLGDAADAVARDQRRVGELQPGHVHHLALGDADALLEDLADDERVLVAAAW